MVQNVISNAALTVCYHPAMTPVLSVFMDVMMASGQLTAMRLAQRTVRMASAMWQHLTAKLVVWLASSETLVTGNAKDVVLESCAINFLMQQSALLAVRLATTEQAVSSSVHTIVLMTSVISLGENVQVVYQEPREACVMRVSICLNESFMLTKPAFQAC